MNVSNETTPARIGPFKATRIWNNIVAYARQHVTTGPHTVKRVKYENSFSGCDIVDVVYHHLLLEKDTFPKKPTREKAAKICQVMMDFLIIESVADNSERGSTFSDSISRIYQFSSHSGDESIPYLNNSTGLIGAKPFSPATSGFMKTKLLTRKRLGSDSVTGSSPSTLKPGRRVVQELHKFSQLWRRHSSTSASGRDAVAPTLTEPRPAWYNQRQSFPQASLSLSSSTAAALSAETLAVTDSFASLSTADDTVDVEELTRETALYALTQMIDLPILDGIISGCTAPVNKSSVSSVCSSTTFFNSGALRRYKSICSVLSEADEKFSISDDGWWLAALSCMELLKGDFDVLSLSTNGCHDDHDDVIRQKLFLFHFIADCYSASGSRSQAGALPLWPDRFADVHKECYRLLMEGRDLELLRTMQCALVLVDDKGREEMRRLIDFLHHVITCTTIQISQLECNGTVVCRLFTRAILHSSLLTPHQLGQLLTFMLTYADRLWQLPDDVSELIDLRLSISSDHPLNNSGLERTYCQRITTDEFCRQKAITTENSLVEMVNSVIDNTRLSLKEKTQVLDDFKRHHADLWLKHFYHIA